jgi:predicted flap endonuclease-1-like 5' DNA nuclease
MIMSRTYWFLIIFVAWCLGCAYWYMFTVKGISTDLNYFRPEDRLVAIVEILVMIMIACLIGLGLGWALRDGQIFSQQENIVKFEREVKALNKLAAQKADELKRQGEAAAHARHELQEQLNQNKQTLSLLKQDLSDIGQQLSETRKEKSEVAHNLERDIGVLQERIAKQQNELDEKDTLVEKYKKEAERVKTQKVEITPNPFARAVEVSEKDDLTKIKGIGPFIEKRLNMIGIYTFKQLSELTPEMIDHIGPAIEFFPHRIIKDNWVGQASRFL